MIVEAELVVVGAGPAGIEAAVTAAESGAAVTLVDLSPAPGGQYFQQSPLAFRSPLNGPGQDRAQRFLHRLSSSKVRVLKNTLVWGIFEGPRRGTWCLTLHGPEAPTRLHAHAVLLATGAFDRSIPFPGWDLPGVITAGAALRMVKHQRVLPGKRIVLSGTGPLQLQTAAYLVQAGAQVVAVCESASALFQRSVPYLTSVWGQWQRIGEGLTYLKVLRRARVPYRLGATVTAAAGEERVSQATICKLDPTGRPRGQKEQIQGVDTVVVGYGLTPRTELCRQLGCALEYEPLCGGFVPRRDEKMQTSLSGIYAAGDGAGLGGAKTALIEGRIAGYAIGERLGHLPPGTAAAQIAHERPALIRERRFAKALNALFTIPAGLYTLADADTVICRCEQVTLGQLREAISYGAQTVNDLKNLARTGMGNCQGRTCGTIIAHLMAAALGKPVTAMHYFNIRPPIQPLPLEVIEEYDKGPDQGEDSE